MIMMNHWVINKSSKKIKYIYVQSEIEKKQRDIHISYLAIPIDGAILGSSSDRL